MGYQQHSFSRGYERSLMYQKEQFHVTFDVRLNLKPLHELGGMISFCDLEKG